MGVILGAVEVIHYERESGPVNQEIRGRELGNMQGKSREICGAGVTNHKGGSREPWNHALSRACKTGCKFTCSFAQKLHP